MKRAFWASMGILLATGMIACGGDGAVDTEGAGGGSISKGDLDEGKADSSLGARVCKEAGLPADCDVCEVRGYYGDGECDTFCSSWDPDCGNACDRALKILDECAQGDPWDELSSAPACLAAHSLLEDTKTCCDEDPHNEEGICYYLWGACKDLNWLHANACEESGLVGCASFPDAYEPVMEMCCERYASDITFVCTD